MLQLFASWRQNSSDQLFQQASLRNTRRLRVCFVLNAVVDTLERQSAEMPPKTKRETKTSAKAENGDDVEDTKPVKNELVELDPQRVFYVPGELHRRVLRVVDVSNIPISYSDR